MSDALSPLARLVLDEDPDRFQTVLFAPAPRRPLLFALYGFEGHLARIAPTVTEPLLGLMRVRWWQEALERAGAGEEDRTGHPVVAALPALVEHLGDTAALLGVIEAHATALETPPRTAAALETQAAATCGVVSGLAVRLLGGGATAENAGCHVGTAWGLLNAIRRQVYADGGDLAAWRPGLARVRAQLDAARAHRSAVPRACLTPLLLATLTDGPLAALSRAESPPAPGRPGHRPARPLRLFFRAALRRY